MPEGLDAEPHTTLIAGPRGWPRDRIALALRRVRFGCLLMWRRHRPPVEEVVTREERLAEHQRTWPERTLAAEEYHWAAIEQSLREADGQHIRATSDVDTVAEPARMARPNAGPMTAQRLIFLNFRQADSGTVEYRQLPHDYVLACRFLHCGIIDRTSTLDQGFDYAVLDRIPAPAIDGPTFAALCDTVGAEIVAEALETRRRISVLWSGGIDSTTALIAIMKAAEARDCRDRVRVLLSHSSVHEYPGFFLRHINGAYRFRSVTHPIAEFLNPAVINVTGEHGDQLFGSQLLESYVRRGLGGVDYRDILPLVILERLGNPRSAHRVERYLEPVIAAAPVPIRTLFDCMWWLNFSLKWQDVTLRLSVFRGDETCAVYGSLRHFFRDERFQAWSLANGAERLPPGWTRYKDLAKQYIFAFSGDQAYYRHKEKEDSLKNVLVDSASTVAYRAFMCEDFRPVVSTVELLPPGNTESGVRSISTNMSDRLRGAVAATRTARRSGAETAQRERRRQ
jgi:hypothetical protein